jgi:hypothetical protein
MIPSFAWIYYEGDGCLFCSSRKHPRVSPSFDAKHGRVYDFSAYLPRHIDAVLLAWTRETDRKPLVLRGARQTGKTAAVRRLAENFDLFLELNLERFEDLALVRSCRSAGQLLTALAARHNLPRFPPRTLLFLDEIQESPEAVARWAAEHNPAAVRGVHRDLVQAKLEAALLIHRALPTSSLALPLRERPRSAAKLLPLDVGLALHTMGSGFETMRGLPLGQVLDGRIAEIFAGQQLLAAAPGFPGELFFWVSESSNSNAEVDYLVPMGGQPVPIEVKSAAAGSLKSLHQFLWRAGLSTGIRLHAGLMADEQLTVRMPEGELAYRLLSLPLYLAEKLPALELAASASLPA